MLLIDFHYKSQMGMLNFDARAKSSDNKEYRFTAKISIVYNIEIVETRIYYKLIWSRVKIFESLNFGARTRSAFTC